jgi:hypothetical protein
VTRWAWLLDHIREELSPYPGRAGAVARMTAGSTIMMLLAMTFRLPYAQYGALYPLSISRNTSRGIVGEARTIVVAFGAAVLHLLLGATLFLHDPSLRLLWVIGTFFLMFYLVSAMTNNSGSARFGYLLIVTLPLWDRFELVEFKVETTLWAFATLSLASVITAAIEVASAGLRPRHQLLQPLADRLASIESVLRSVAAGEPFDHRTRDDITRYAMTGTSRVRTTLFHSSYSPQYREQMGVVIALVGRLTDLAANAVQLSPTESDSDRTKIATLLAHVDTIRSALLSGSIPHVVELVSDPGVPLFDEMEHTVSLVADVLAGLHSVSADVTLDPAPPSTGAPPVRFLVADAFSNPRHILFGLKGCLAATLCYVIYNAVDWPGHLDGGDDHLSDSADHGRRVAPETDVAHRRRLRGRTHGHRCPGVHTAPGRFDWRVHGAVRAVHRGFCVGDYVECPVVLRRRPDGLCVFPGQRVRVRGEHVAHACTRPRRRHSAGPFRDVDRVRPVVGISRRRSDEEGVHLHASKAGATRPGTIDPGHASG